MSIGTPATRSVETLTSDAAQRLVAAAVTRAAQSGKRMVISVCDAGGHLLAYRRMDGAPLQAIAISQDKAYTAAGFGLPTDQWHDVLKEEPPLALGAGASHGSSPSAVVTRSGSARVSSAASA